MPAHLYKGHATIKLDGYRKKDTIETRAVCIRLPSFGQEQVTKSSHAGTRSVGNYV